MCGQLTSSSKQRAGKLDLNSEDTLISLFLGDVSRCFCCVELYGWSVQWQISFFQLCVMVQGQDLEGEVAQEYSSEAAFVQRTRADWWAPESSEVPGPLLLLHPQIHPSPFLLVSAMEASSCLPRSSPHHVPSPPNTLILPSDSLSAHRPAQVAHENTFLKTYLLSRCAPQALPFPPALHDLPQEQSAVPASPSSPRAFVPSTVLDLVNSPSALST